MLELVNRIAAIWSDQSRATPTGGAHRGGRGCTVVILLSLAGSATAAPIDVPSGRAVEALEYLSDVDEAGTVLRARYVAPDLEGGEDFDLIFADMTHLCEADALELRDTMVEKPARVIVSLSSKAIEFGTVDASVTQYFEAFAVENGRCIWELF